MAQASHKPHYKPQTKSSDHISVCVCARARAPYLEASLINKPCSTKRYIDCNKITYR